MTAQQDACRILREAADIIEAREKQYNGHGDMFEHISELSDVGVSEVFDVWIATKQVRLIHTPGHHDSLVDLVAYTALKACKMNPGAVSNAPKAPKDPLEELIERSKKSLGQQMFTGGLPTPAEVAKRKEIVEEAEQANRLRMEELLRMQEMADPKAREADIKKMVKEMNDLGYGYLAHPTELVQLKKLNEEKKEPQGESNYECRTCNN